MLKDDLLKSGLITQEEYDNWKEVPLNQLSLEQWGEFENFMNKH